MVFDGCDGILMLELMQQLASCQVPYLYRIVYQITKGTVYT